MRDEVFQLAGQVHAGDRLQQVVHTEIKGQQPPWRVVVLRPILHNIRKYMTLLPILQYYHAHEGNILHQN